MNSFNARTDLVVDGVKYEIFSLQALESGYNVSRLPYSLKILLENLLRLEDGVDVTMEDIKALANWDPKVQPDKEISFTPARVVLQDFTGVPAVVDLAAMRAAMAELGGDTDRINPLSPVDLVIDHSVQVDNFGINNALDLNARIEFDRNRERYAFLRWGQQTFSNFRVVPPGTGIVHQVNLEYLASVVFTKEDEGVTQAYPDTLVGTDSHTTMINGIGVLGWGVGGIEAEAGMLGQPISMLIPQVVGFRLTGELTEGVTATDLVLTVTQMLRQKGVVGKFVEFCGDGLGQLPLTDRATIANMAPEYGATCGIFPIDAETLRYMRLSGRSDEQIALVEAYARAQGIFREPGSPEAEYSDMLELDLSTVEPSLSGPKLPQDRIPLRNSKSAYQTAVNGFRKGELDTDGVAVEYRDQSFSLKDGAVVIAAITSCTNTSNPSVMVAAGLLARKAARLGLNSKPWVKTSLAPGSQVVTDYLKQAGLLEDLAQLGFSVVGYGCTTCIGNSGPLPGPIADAIQQNDLACTSVLSGNRNFEGRIHPQVKMNYLASPPLVVAYALAGTMDIDLYADPLGTDRNGNPVYLRDIWPGSHEVQDIIHSSINPEMFRSAYDGVFSGDERWQALNAVASKQYEWDLASTYIRKPTYFDGMPREPEPVAAISGARVLALLGDNVTTDHISPAGSIAEDSPAGVYLKEKGILKPDFNSYGSRRGNHEVMLRGTFANIRLRNLLAPGTEGGWTRYQPSGEQMTIFDAAMRYQEEGTPLVVMAGKEYGTGSSRDWAAKGTRLLGVRAVLAVSYERIHRSNLVGMGVLPLQFLPGANAETLGLDGSESFDLADVSSKPRELNISATRTDGGKIVFRVAVRIDTPKEWEYFMHGGILHYVLRRLARDG